LDHGDRRLQLVGDDRQERGAQFLDLAQPADVPEVGDAADRLALVVADHAVGDGDVDRLVVPRHDDGFDLGRGAAFLDQPQEWAAIAADLGAVAGVAAEDIAAEAADYLL